MDDSRRQAEAAFGMPPPPRRHPVLRALLPLVGLVVLGTAAVLGVIALAGGVENEREPSVRPAVPSLPTPPGPGPPRRPAPPRAGSLFAPAGFRGAIATARRLAGPGARVETLRLDAGRATIVARAGSRRKVILVSPGYTRTITTPAPASSRAREFAFGALDPRAPARMLAGIRRYGVRPRGIAYMVALRNPIAPGLMWLAFRAGGGGYFQGDARGGSVRRVG